MANKVKFFDTHCHLHEEIFDKDRDTIISKMKDLGIERFLTIGTSVKDTERALRLRDKYPDTCLVSGGLDPTGAQKYVGSLDKAERDFGSLAKIAGKEEISAIGETGLDKNWRVGPEFTEQFTPESLQIQHLLFELHIDLARELDLPLVIHQRDALTPTLKTLSDKKFVGLNGKKIGVFHSFTGKPEEAQKVIDAGFYIGINGIVTFKSASSLQSTIRAIDAEHILLETDAPFLTPEPYRGQRNDPTFLPVIAESVEGLKGKSTHQQIYEQSLDFFS